MNLLLSLLLLCTRLICMTVIHSLYLLLSLSLPLSLSIYLPPISPSLPPSTAPSSLYKSLSKSTTHTPYSKFLFTYCLTFCTSSPPTQANIDILGEPADAQGASKMGTYASPYSSVLSSVRYFDHLIRIKSHCCLSPPVPHECYILLSAFPLVFSSSLISSLLSCSLLSSHFFLLIPSSSFSSFLSSSCPLLSSSSCLLSSPPSPLPSCPSSLLTPRSAGGILLTLLSKFATCVADSVDGKGSTAEGVEMNDLYGGARISYIFNEVGAADTHLLQH
jgi:hypothetical protein